LYNFDYIKETDFRNAVLVTFKFNDCIIECFVRARLCAEEMSDVVSYNCGRRIPSAQTSRTYKGLRFEDVPISAELRAEVNDGKDVLATQPYATEKLNPANYFAK